jgi:ABC-2 type transport system ATP-binding protein
MPPKVVVRDLWKRYGPVDAARGVSFEIQEGETFGLLGPNGAGKTTTVECVVGLREPDAGEVAICGIDARRHPQAAKARIGAALQTTALQDKITPREALALFGAFYPRHAAPDTLLERFSLREKADAAFDTLSGGQRQRLALALAFVSLPDLVFLDEPTSGLDPQSRRELRGEIASMKREGHTVLLTTHDMDEAQTLCDRVAIIDRGRIIATGTPEQLIAQSAASTAVSFTTVGPVAAALLTAVPGLEDVQQQAEFVRFRTASLARTLADLMSRLAAANVEITELHVQKGTLEDVFLELTGDEGPTPQSSDGGPGAIVEARPIRKEERTSTSGRNR